MSWNDLNHDWSLLYTERVDPRIWQPASGEGSDHDARPESGRETNEGKYGLSEHKLH